MPKSKLVIIDGPSGCGKKSLIQTYASDNNF